MAISNDDLTKRAASFKTAAQKRFDKALNELIALAWDYRYLGDDFTFEADPELYDKALEICRNMSDGCIEDAEYIVRFFFDTDMEIDNVLADEAQDSFDMAGTHLLQLLNIWIAVAFAKGFTKSYTEISIKRYMTNPLASGLFRVLGKDFIKWGRGYDRNLINQLTVIGQNLIIGSVREEEWRLELENGATYYIRRRGSNYDCPTCEDLCGYPIPISEPWELTHSRCCCYPEYHYEPLVEI